MDPTAQLKALGIKTTADIAGGRQLSADVIRASDQRILDGYLAKQQRKVVDPDFKQAEQAANKKMKDLRKRTLMSASTT